LNKCLFGISQKQFFWLQFHKVASLVKLKLFKKNVW
jgi:hypothetical protein